MLTFDAVTDLAININHIDRSIAFPGPLKVQGTHLEELCARLAKECEGIEGEEFTLQFESQFWRCHRDNMVIDGRWLRLRKSPSIAPSLETLGVPLPAAIAEILLSSELSRGGLVLVMGSTGSGKTTSASATVVSRLKKFGGLAYTVEDPPEHPLNGWHGGGYCAQTKVKGAGDSADAWAKSLKGALRSQPAATTTILFVGEIREDEAAKIALKAAGDGFLVIATAFAKDIVAGITSFAGMVGESEYAMLASQLRVVIHQKLNGEILQVGILVAPENSSTAALIRRGQFPSIADEVNSQRNMLKLGQDLLQQFPRAA